MAFNSRGRGGKKKPRSFLYKAKKYGVKGLYGRGKNVDEETYNYFVRVMERLKDEFEDEEEKEIFVSNVFQQTAEKEMDLICNQVISKVLEKLLPLATPEILRKFAEIIRKDMRIICTDPYASHVLEKIMHICLETVSCSETKHPQEHVDFCMEWLCSICRYAFNNVEDFISDIYASHILRSSMQCLSGVQVEVGTMKSRRSRRHMDDKETENAVGKFKSDEFIDILRDFGERFVAWPQILDLAHTDNSSAVIQTALYCFHSSIPEVGGKLLKVLVNDILPTVQGGVFSSSSIVHLFEACVSVSDDETLALLYRKYLAGQLRDLAQDFNSKFTVVKLLETVNDKELFTEIFEELVPGLEDYFASGCGIVVAPALACTCQRLNALQAQYLKALMETFHCFDPEARQTHIVKLVSRLITFEIAMEDEKKIEDVTKTPFAIHHIGSQIVQTLLHFSKPIKIVQSLLDMEMGALRDLFCDLKGSHIMDAFASSQFVGEKSREKLFNKLKGSYFCLATSKGGSRALEALWQSLDVKSRMSIAEELLEKESALSGNQYGLIIFHKFTLGLFRHEKVDWKAMQEKEGKKRKLFAGLVDVAPSSSDVKRAKKEKKNKKVRQSSEST